MQASKETTFESNTVLLQPKNNFAECDVLLFSASAKRFQSKNQKLEFLHCDIGPAILSLVPEHTFLKEYWFSIY